MRAGPGFEPARDGAPQAAGQCAANDDDGHVNDRRDGRVECLGEPITKPGRGQCTQRQLSFGADVEQAAFESDRDGQTGKDVRRGPDEGL